MRKLLVIAMVVFALSVGLSTPVRATSPTVGSGTYTFTSVTPTSTGQAGGNTFVSVSFTEVLTGILAGSCSGAATEVIHSATGSANVYGSETCTGTAAGLPGTFSLLDVGTVAADGSLQGHFALSGTGTLANLHGQGTAQGSILSGTYAVQVHFDP